MAWWQRQFGGSTRGRIVAMLRREAHSVEELASSLGLTDNAVRAQLVTLERDRVVHVAGVRREGGVGKPATLFRVGSETATLFSSAYAPLLAALLAELSDRMPARSLAAVVRAAGRRLAPTVAAGATLDERARAGAGLLADLGADAELVRTKEGYEIRGYSCVLSAAVAACPATCGAVEALLSEATGTRVQERCDRAGDPRCHFLIPAAS